MATDIWQDLLTHLKNSSESAYFWRKLYAFYCQNNKWNNFSSCWWSNIVHVNISSSYFVLFFFFSLCISFDFTSYLEPKLFRELTRKPTGSFSFLACTLFSLYLRFLLHFHWPIRAFRVNLIRKISTWKISDAIAGGYCFSASFLAEPWLKELLL